jgi:hypothetical protein
MIDYDPERIYQNINEETDSGSIAYIPGGFAPVRKKLKTLAKKKHDWGIHIYDDRDFKRVVFEDSLIIHVQEKDWGTFVEEMGLIQEDGRYRLHECLDSEVYEGKIDFSNILESDITEEWNKSIDKTMASLKGLLYRKGFNLFEKEIENWKNTFSECKESIWPKSILSSCTLESDLRLIETRLREEYENDLGGLDILTYELQNGNVDSIFELMENTDYLLSAHIESKINEVTLNFEILMDRKFRLSESVLIDKGNILLEASGNKEFVISNKLIFPSRGLFGFSGMSSLKHITEGYLEE